MSRFAIFALAAVIPACAVDSPDTRAPDFFSPNGILSVSRHGFVDDGSRWWTDSTGPTLHGRIEVQARGPIGAPTQPLPVALQVFIGDSPFGTRATITDGEWSVALPPGTIGAHDTRIVIRVDGDEPVE